MIAKIDKKIRNVKISLVQQGPAKDSKEKNIEMLLQKVDEIAQKENPDFLMFTELSTTLYFPAGLPNFKYFSWAEPIPGTTTKSFGEKAKKYGMCIILPLFEKASIEGIYYNSAVVIGPDGNLIQGSMPDDSKVLRYAKNHIPYKQRMNNRFNERFYFKEGPGFPVFNTPKAKIGIAICFDRRFPESFRMLSLQGAEIAFVPVCSFSFKKEYSKVASNTNEKNDEEMYISELRTRAFENCMWICNANRVGVEKVGNKKTKYYGLSAIIHPSGKVVMQASSTKPAVISSKINLEENNKIRFSSSKFKLRRPEIYSLIGNSIT